MQMEAHHHCNQANKDLAQCVLFDGNRERGSKGKMNGDGKTCTRGAHDHQPNPLPYGPPRLQWSFNRDGEVKPRIATERDRSMSFDMAEEKKGPACQWACGDCERRHS